MTAEFAGSFENKEQPLKPFDLAAHIAERALNDPAYSIDYTHPDLVIPTAEVLALDERLDVYTPVIYPRGNTIGRLALRVSASRAPLAAVISFPISR